MTHVWRKLGSISEFSLCIYYKYRLDSQTLYVTYRYIIYIYRYIFTLNMLSLAIETDWDCQYFYTISSYVLLTSASGWLAAQGTLVAIAVYRLQGDEGICRVGDGSFCSLLPTPACDFSKFPKPLWCLPSTYLGLNSSKSDKKTEIHILKDTKRIPSVWTPEIIHEYSW